MYVYTCICKYINLAGDAAVASSLRHGQVHCAVRARVIMTPHLDTLRNRVMILPLRQFAIFSILREQIRKRGDACLWRYCHLAPQRTAGRNSQKSARY